MWFLLAMMMFAQADPMGPFLEDDPFGPSAADTGAPEAARCNTQVLRDGVQLPISDELYKHWRPGRDYGTAELVNVLQTAAAEVAWRMPDADPVVVGDMSFKKGGPLKGHRSHRGGLDADVGLYWGDAQMYMQGHIEVSAAAFDPEANWLLIKTLLDTGMVERILLDQRFINKLKRHLISTGELTAPQAREIFPNPDHPTLWALDGVVQHAPGHRHHMHVRVFCDDTEGLVGG